MRVLWVLHRLGGLTRFWIFEESATFDGVEGDGDLLDDFYAETLQRRDVGAVVGEQPDFVDAEVGENLAAESDLAEDALVAVVGAFDSAAVAVEAETAGLDGAVDAKSALGVVKIDERAAAGFGDRAE